MRIWTHRPGLYRHISMREMEKIIDILNLVIIAWNPSDEELEICLSYKPKFKLDLSWI